MTDHTDPSGQDLRQQLDDLNAELKKRIIPYIGTHHLPGYHSEQEWYEAFFGRGAGDPDMTEYPGKEEYDSNNTLIVAPSSDGIYPRCVYCRIEIYGPNVIDYSKGESRCHNCLHRVPEEYLKVG